MFRTKNYYENIKKNKEEYEQIKKTSKQGEETETIKGQQLM